MPPPISTTPSPNLLAGVQAELAAHAPFSRMAAEHVQRFAAAALQLYFAPEETVLEPASGPVTQLLWIRRGHVVGRRGMAELSGGAFRYEAGDLFPVGALLGARSVTAHYQSQGDTFCLAVPAAVVQELAAQSAPFADFLNHRMLQFLQLSREALQAQQASRALAEQTLETPLARFARKEPLACAPDTPLAQALGAMHERRVGSMLVADAAGAPVGILTRHDILERVTLAQVPLATPIERVMSAPVRTLTVQHTAQDAALLMSRHGIRHVPVMEGGRVVSIVSERDLFALQRRSLGQVSQAIRDARHVADLQGAAQEIRHLARHLLAQGVQARQLTELISHLNDLLTERLVGLLAAQHGLDLERACWLAFGSEGRGEQTIATDQDNGLVFESDQPDADRPRWLALAHEVNQALDSCGYPLCKGNVMASNPVCCLRPDEWRARFAHWVEHGAPEDLLNASIYFDLRPVAGNAALAAPLRAYIDTAAKATPRFLKQMADNALRSRAPLNWLGAIDAPRVNGKDVLDLKLHGTALFVESARLFALAQGAPVLGTRARFEAVAEAMRVPANESEAWVSGFEYLQMLRLTLQLDAPRPGAADNPNLIELDSLNDIDRRVLRESLRVARRLQQRLELDYGR